MGKQATFEPMGEIADYWLCPSINSHGSLTCPNLCLLALSVGQALDVFLDPRSRCSSMVRGYLLILFVATLDQARLARQYIRKPAILSQIYSVLTHSVLSDLYPFSPQGISLMACGTRSPFSLVNIAQ